MLSLKHLSNLWKSLEKPLINCEINLILTWSANCVISSTDTKLYVPVVTLSTDDNAKLPQQLKSGFKRTINYHSKVTIQAQNQYLDYLIDPRLQGVNGHFVLSFIMISQ